MSLLGEVTHKFESDAAYEAVARLKSLVLGITNEIECVHGASVTRG